MWPAVGTFCLFLRSQELHSLTPLTSQRTRFSEESRKAGVFRAVPPGSRCGSWDKAVRGARGSRGRRVILPILPSRFSGWPSLRWRGRGRGSEVPKGPDEEAAKSAGTSLALRVCGVGGCSGRKLKGLGGWRLRRHDSVQK